MNRLLVLMTLIIGTLNANEVVVTSPDGDTATFQDIEDYNNLQDQIEAYFGIPSENQKLYLEQIDKEDQEPKIDFQVTFVEKGEKREQSPLTTPRDFDKPLTTDDVKDIKYIITTLANKPTAKLLFYKSSLDSAGDRVNHVHPLRFLATIFVDEEMKVGIFNMTKKSWVWKEFMKGLSDTLTEENNRANVLPEHVDAFAAIVNIDVSLIADLVERAKWEDFVQALIKHIPRKKGNNYDM